MWSVYIIRCGDGTLYTGISNDVTKRFAIHQTGGKQSAKYTRSRQPLTLAFTAEVGTQAEASRIEYRIKQLPKQKKEKLIRGQVALAELIER